VNHSGNPDRRDYRLTLVRMATTGSLSTGGRMTWKVRQCKSSTEVSYVYYVHIIIQ